MKKGDKDVKFYMYVIRSLQQGLNPSKIAANLHVSRQSINHYIASLKRSGNIEKIGYGVWKVKDVKVCKTNTVTYGKHAEIKPDTVRGHSFQFKLFLPTTFRNWDKREELFKKNGIELKPLFVGGIKRGQKLTIDNKKIWLTNKSIIIYDPKSYFNNTSRESKEAVLKDFFNTILKLQSAIKANFGKYHFKICSNHYALIKNGLAQTYEKDNSKLKVIGDDGKVWLLIDNSLNLNELETIHPKTGENDNKIVQDFFNSLKEHPFTPEQLKKVMAMMSENQFDILQIIKQMENNFKEFLSKYGNHLKKYHNQ